MHTTNLRKVGGSIMLALPPAILDLLNLSAGSAVGLSVANGKIMIEPPQARYRLDELLAQCDPDAPISEEDRLWLDNPPIGKEII